MKHSFLYRALAVVALGCSWLEVSGAQAADAVKPAPVYPDASRRDPKPDLKNAKEQKILQEGLNAASAGDSAKATPLLQSILDHSDSRYAKALAGQGLANLHYKAGDTKGAIQLLSAALASDALPNENFFPLQYELAQLYLAAGEGQRSIDTVEQWRRIGKHDTADSHALEGQAYYQLQQYPQAIGQIQQADSLTKMPDPSWQQVLLASYSQTGQIAQAVAVARQQLASRPNDPQVRQNAVAVFTNAHQYSDAIQVLEQTRAAGKLGGEKDYVTLAKLHLIVGRNSDDAKPEAGKAQAVLNEGFSRGMLGDSADNEELLGNAALMAGDDSAALTAYEKAIPLAKDGEPSLRAGQLLLQKKQLTEAKRLIQQAIDKGVQHRGTAYMLLADADAGLKDRAGAIAAMKRAAADPETAEKATAWLKKAGQ